METVSNTQFPHYLSINRLPTNCIYHEVDRAARQYLISGDSVSIVLEWWIFFTSRHWRMKDGCHIEKILTIRKRDNKLID